MKTLAAVLAGALVAVLLFTAGATAQTPAVKRVTVGASIETVRVTNGHLRVGDTRSDLMLLWEAGNPKPIGTAYVFCHFYGRGGLLGSGLWWCDLEVVMPLGKFLASGRRKSPRFFSWPITGATRIYAGASGTVTVRPHLPSRLELVVTYR